MLASVEPEQAPTANIPDPCPLSAESEEDVPGHDEAEVATVVNFYNDDNELDHWYRDLINSNVLPRSALQVQPTEPGAGASAWYSDAPVTVIGDNESCEDMASQCDPHIIELNPVPGSTPTHCMDHDHLAVNPQVPVDFTIRPLSDIVNWVQRHLSSPAYCQRTRKAPAQEAHPGGNALAVPAPDAADCVISQELTTLRGLPAPPQRCLPTAVHPMLALSWLANTDISPCTGFKALMNYAAKYYSKAEMGSQSAEEAAKTLTAYVNAANPVLTFECKYMNSHIVERDLSAQECAHLLLGLPHVEDSRTVVGVHCRPYAEHVKMVDIPGDGEDGDITSHATSPVRKWDFQGDPANWKKKGPRAKATVHKYFPRYRSEPSTSFYEHCCQVKITLNYPRNDQDNLLRNLSTWAEAYAHCRDLCTSHDNDYYGEELPVARPDEFNSLQPYLLLGVHDQDLQQNRSGQVGRYPDPDFDLDQQPYWSTFLRERVASAPTFRSWSDCEDLNTEQRIAYEHINLGGTLEAIEDDRRSEEPPVTVALPPVKQSPLYMPMPVHGSNVIPGEPALHLDPAQL
ncbi:hypothetical protein HOY82DRAFT_634109 [Tuber indicum]|nr:hypothetical protein HOY82DRAFT_634109 [Tuber indicum]